MTTAYTSLLGLALPVDGELTGTWGQTVNNYITTYLDGAVAGTQIISGSLTAVTLSKTTGASLSQAGTGATGSSQYQIIRCTGNPASLLTITAPAADKTYVVINATSTSQSVKIVGVGPTTGVTVTAGSQALVAWNGSDFVNITPAGTNGTVTSVAALTLGTTGADVSSTVANGTTTPVITLNLPTASATNRGALSSTDWTAFNGKYSTGGALGTPSSGTLSSCTVDGTNGVGYINIPQNSQSAAYTLVAADAGKHIFHPSTDANARTFTIPANGSVAYPIGTAISFVNMTSQVVSIAITTDTMYLAGTGTTGTRSLAQYGTATALKMTSTTWIISGAGLT
jgi:hypothetical protein